MISFNYETKFKLENEEQIRSWILAVISEENYVCDYINYVFCNDYYLHKINLEYLKHDTLTDIISFDYSIGKNLQGDVFISIDRVKENARLYSPNFENELARVIVHGVLHFCGYKDKTDIESASMRDKENFYLKELLKF